MTAKRRNLLRPLKAIDFSIEDDYELSLLELLEALELVTPPAQQFEKERPEPEFEDRQLRGREAYQRGKVFEREVGTLYKLLGFDVDDSRKIAGVQFDLSIHLRRGISFDAAVECKELRVTAKERDQIIAANAILKQEFPSWQHAVVSSRGFADDSRTALEKLGISCTTYQQLLQDLVPLEQYVQRFVLEFEEWVADEKKLARPRLVHPALCARRIHQ